MLSINMLLGLVGAFFLALFLWARVSARRHAVWSVLRHIASGKVCTRTNNPKRIYVSQRQYRRLGRPEGNYVGDTVAISYSFVEKYTGVVAASKARKFIKFCRNLLFIFGPVLIWLIGYVF